MKKLTRILIVLSLLAILASVITIQAFAADTSRITIDRVDVYAPEPQPGQDPDEFEKLITYAEQDCYTVSTGGVSVGAGGSHLEFRYGGLYNLRLYINAQAGYTLDNTKIFINGEDTGRTISGQKVIYSYYIILGEPLSQIDLPGWPEGIKAGDDASACQPELPEDANFTVKATWLNTSYEPVSKVESGKVYYLEYTIKPKEGYHFKTVQTHNEDTVLTIGGNVVTCYLQNHEITIMKSYGIDVQPISVIDISYIRPRIGDLRSDFKVEVSEGMKLHNTYIETSSTPTQSIVFEEGICYTLRVTMYPLQGYVFAEDVTVTFNGSSPQQFQFSANNVSTKAFYQEIEFALPIQQVDFPAFPETVTPGPGGISDIAVPEGAGYTIKQAWIDMRTGQIVEAVEAGDIYTLAYMAEPKPGYVFDENTKATLGGENCEVFAEDRYMVVYRSYDLGAQKLDRVDITLPRLYKGCTPGAATVPQGANYTLMELIWAESTTESFEDSQPVEAVNYNTNIFAFPVLCAGKGYTFAEDTKLFFNGVEVSVVFRYAEGPMIELAGLYGTLTPPTTDGWCQEDNTWVYYVDGQKLVSQWYKDSKDWVYLGADGKMLKNTWQRDSKGWCYLGEKGYMLRSSWLNDGGKWYYLNSSGYMLSNTWYKDSKDWVYLGKDGAMLTNTWQKDSKGWCYLGASGYMVRNAWVADSVGYCRLDGSGYMVKNKWVHDGYGWAYLDARGYAVIGDWVNYQGQWFAMDADGYMLSNCWITYKGDVYRLAADGHMLTDQWVDDGKGWSYVDKDGKVPFDSFVRDSKGICYITSGGYIAKSQWIKKDGKQYYADSTGHLLRNTTQKMTAPNSYTITYTYKFDSNGVATIVNPW